MKPVIFFSLLLTVVRSFSQDPLPPVGQWREHLPYNSAIDLDAGDGTVYCATPYSLFSVSLADNSIDRYSRVTGLSETGVSAIRYDGNTHKLFIAYGNSNIDILYRNDIHNIPDIKRDNIIGDKTIYNIYSSGNLFYLSAGLGVIVIDALRYEVKDTWFIGNGGNPVKVNGFAADASFFYAATEEGLKRVPVNSPHPADYANWQLLSGTNGLPAGPSKNVLALSGNIIVQKNDSLLRFNGSSWSLLYTDGWPFISSRIAENKILLCERQVSGSSRVQVLNPDGTVARSLTGTAALSFPRQAILYNNDTWVADQYTCLVKIGSLPAFVPYSLNAPQGMASGDLVSYRSVFYAASGSVNEAWNYLYNGDGVFQLKEGTWTNNNRYRYPVLDSLLDFICLAADPRDESLWAGSYGGGLLHIKPGPSFEIFKQNYLGAATGDPGSYRVSGLAMDGENNLWVSNYGAAQPVRVRKNDGSWKSFSLPSISFPFMTFSTLPFEPLKPSTDVSL